MKLLDVNLLLYAYNADSSRHTAARPWLEDQLSGTETIALPWVVLLGFLRISTRPAVYPNPLSAAQALDLIDSWLSQPCTVVVHPTERHAAILRDLIIRIGTAGNLTTDAHLAALAIEHGAQLCSADPDFSRFPGLRWLDPLR
ncbi:MAG: type II toxin-antitoxin system VapC family toxin [Pseudonocardiaceae bacterium]